MARFCPAERMLVETDSPYMSPEPLRGTVNTPLNVPIIVKKMSTIYEKSEEEMKSILYENACRFYRIKF
ncbi:MAG TPA: hypothetical protein DDW16_05045 [Clostridiales bacterium]|nr:hypothetical protein [Clostridiales bacterium]